MLKDGATLAFCENSFCRNLTTNIVKIKAYIFRKEISQGIYLRVPTFFHQTFQVYHVYCNFILPYICRITENFGTLKDISLLINIFASNNCFSDRNIFQNGVKALSKIDDAFLTKRWKFYLVRIIRFCSNFASLWHRHLLWNYKWNFRLPMSAFIYSNKKYPIGTSIFYTDFCIQALSYFQCCC